MTRWISAPACTLLVLAGSACGGGGTEPPIATSLTLSPTTVSFTAVGQTRQLATTITDQRGDPIEGSAVGWQSSDESVVTVTTTGLVTATGPGTAQVTAAVGELDAVAEVAVSQSLANFEAAGGSAQAAPAGQALPAPLVVAATDELGSPIAGLAVEFVVTQGGGSIAPQATVTGADGRASAVWTLGPTEGAAQQARARVSGTDRSVTFAATASGEPASVEVFAGTGQSALAGTAVPVRPAVRELDSKSQPVAGVQVQFSVVTGSGSVTDALATTDGQGVATVGSWALGPSGVNTLTASVPGLALSGDPALFVATVRPAGGFDIRIRHQGTPTASQLLAFAEAEVRWEAIITGDLPDVPVNTGAGACGTGSPALSESVDDILIVANLTAIDGPGGVLGAAGPCLIRSVGSLPILGQMRFDTDDLELLESSNLLSVVILHEMGHVLGIGTLWNQLGLLTDASLSGGADPHFSGPLAIAAFDDAGGASYTGGKVPVEDTGGQGTADSHWRESVFATELMTGFIGAGANPLSAVTVQALDDQGYTVNPAAADGFSLGASLRLNGIAGPVFTLHDDVARGPIYTVDAQGAVTGTVVR
jgi:hypothetical protein